MQILKKYLIYSTETIKLKSGIETHWYFDARKIFENPSDVKLVVNELISRFDQYKPDVITTIPTDGIGWLSAFTLGGYKVSYVRTEEKLYGLQKRIEGAEIKSAYNVVIFDGTSTTGNTLAFAVNEVRKHNAKVNNAVVICDRNQGARELLNSMDVKLECLVSLENLLNV